jgi:hypothetical protein
MKRNQRHARSGNYRFSGELLRHKGAESVSLYPYLVKLGDLEKFRFLLDR